PAATTAAWCWPRSWPACSSAWASRPGSTTGIWNVADKNERLGPGPDERAGQHRWEAPRPAPAAAPTRTRRPAGGRRPLTPMPKGDPWSLPGPPPGGPAVVADDGGSSGRLRRAHDCPAPGDLRKCLVALAAPDTVWREAFEHRFCGGDLDGHALGNLVIVGLAEVLGDFGRALEEAGRLLDCAGRVLPATTDPVVLTAEAGDGA